MTEQELRQLVRETIARVSRAHPAGRGVADGGRVLSDAASRSHASFALLNIPDGGGVSSDGASSDGEGPCIIEPAVPCNHCGYCKSYGH